MKTKIDLFTYSCTGCGICTRRCPKHVLHLVSNGKIRFVTVWNADACDGCKKCEKICRHNAIRIVNEYERQQL
ncbi:MAG: 4Fe-4S binding protein [Bacteroidales bacterium]|nr:4Fe-4S binding protein [Bacteroidales bacterium]MCI2145394.1 4Fe-4S binding protein [Bacteroidales bacterium]